MAAELFLRVGTIGLSKRGGRKPSTIVQAARHNMRTEQHERGARAHINPALSHQNEHLCGPETPEAVAALAQSIMAAHGVAVDKLRKDYTQACEVLFSLPADTPVDTGRFFADCVAWASKAFGGENILSADIHRDEPAPHCHVLVLPMSGGRWVGSALVTREKVAALVKGFYDAVGRRYGLRQTKRIDSTARGLLAAAVLQRLNAAGDPAMTSMTWQAIREAIERDPRAFAQALGLELAAPSRKLRTMAQIFTSKGCGAGVEKPIGFEADGKEVKPIGFKAKKDRNLSCVGFAEFTTLVEPQPTARGAATDGVPPPPGDAISASTTGKGRVARPAPAPATERDGEGETRVRDADMVARQWCEELGEWVAAPAPRAKDRRAAAAAWVAEALGSVRDRQGDGANFPRRSRAVEL